MVLCCILNWFSCWDSAATLQSNTFAWLKVYIDTIHLASHFTTLRFFAPYASWRSQSGRTVKFTQKSIKSIDNCQELLNIKTFQTTLGIHFYNYTPSCTYWFPFICSMCYIRLTSKNAKQSHNTKLVNKIKNDPITFSFLSRIKTNKKDRYLMPCSLEYIC